MKPSKQTVGVFGKVAELETISGHLLRVVVIGLPCSPRLGNNEKTVKLKSLALRPKMSYSNRVLIEFANK